MVGGWGRVKEAYSGLQWSPVRTDEGIIAIFINRADSLSSLSQRGAPLDPGNPVKVAPWSPNLHRNETLLLPWGGECVEGDRDTQQGEVS